MNLNKRVTIALIFSITLLYLTFQEYYWQQISIFAPLVGITIILVLTLVITVKFFSTLLTLFKHRNELTFKLVSPTLIYLITILLLYFHPNVLDANYHQPEVQYRGCYEGTVNTGTILFRENGQFEYRHVGFFGITTFEKGKWLQSGDTLSITFDGEVQEFVGTKLLITDERFIKIEADSLLTNKVGFYRGFCKGLN